MSMRSITGALAVVAGYFLSDVAGLYGYDWKIYAVGFGMGFAGLLMGHFG